jgi:hypothetical protein
MIKYTRMCSISVALLFREVYRYENYVWNELATKQYFMGILLIVGNEEF